jgi:hypothetical protein
LVSKSPGSTPTQITGEKEKMDGFLIGKYLLQSGSCGYSTAVPVVNTVSKIKVGASEEKHYTGARTKGLNASYILIDFVSENRKSVWQCTRPEHRTETLKGISVGSTEQDVLEKSRSPERGRADAPGPLPALSEIHAHFPDRERTGRGVGGVSGGEQVNFTG